jgi:hypothetical protein
MVFFFVHRTVVIAMVFVVNTSIFTFLSQAELPSIACDSASVVNRIYRAANVLQVPTKTPSPRLQQCLTAASTF